MATVQKKLRQKLSDLIRQMLGERASIKLLKEIDEDLVKELAAGKTVPTIAELLTQKIIKHALDPKEKNQWAIELILDRVEGKPGLGVAARPEDRVIEEQLDAITTEHLNAIASKYAKRKASDELAGPTGIEDTAAGPAARLLDLSKDGPAGAQEVEGEPELAAGVAEAGGG